MFCPHRLQSNRPSRDVFPSCFREIGRLINQALAASQSPSKNCRAAAVGNSATRRRIGRIILASVVNAPNRRRRGLSPVLPSNGWFSVLAEYLPTALARKVMRSVVSVRPSVSTLQLLNLLTLIFCMCTLHPTESLTWVKVTSHLTQILIHFADFLTDQSPGVELKNCPFYEVAGEFMFCRW